MKRVLLAFAISVIASIAAHAAILPYAYIQSAHNCNGTDLFGCGGGFFSDNVAPQVREIAPGGLYAFDLGFYNNVTNQLVDNVQYTNDLTDYTNFSYLQVLDDGAYITASNGCTGNLYIRRAHLISDDSTAQRFIFYWPGSSYPEYGTTTCSPLTGPTNVTFTFHAGQGKSPASIPNTAQITIAALPAVPIVYGSTPAPVAPMTRIVPNGLYYNSYDNAYKSLTTCYATPVLCPKQTIVGGVTYTNYMVLYTQAFGDAFSASYIDWVFKFDDFTDPTVTYRGPVAYNYEQWNISLATINGGPDLHFHFETTPYYSGIFGQTYTAKWLPSKGVVKFGPTETR